MTILPQLPKDLTPIQRAQLKLASHLAIMFALNAVLVAGVLLSNNKLMDWHTVLVAAVSQAAFAVLDALKKYLSAHGDVSLNTIVGLAQAEVQARAPVVQMSDIEQSLANALNAYLSQQTLNTPAPIAPDPSAKLQSASALSDDTQKLAAVKPATASV